MRFQKRGFESSVLYSMTTTLTNCLLWHNHCLWSSHVSVFSPNLVFLEFAEVQRWYLSVISFLDRVERSPTVVVLTLFVATCAFCHYQVEAPGWHVVFCLPISRRYLQGPILGQSHQIFKVCFFFSLPFSLSLSHIYSFTHTHVHLMYLIITAV